MSLLTDIHSYGSRFGNQDRVLSSPDGDKLIASSLGFKGHGVTVKAGEKCVKDAHHIFASALRDRYGDHVVNKLAQDWGSTSRPLTVRTAMALDKKAAKMHAEMTSQNLRGGRSMLRQGLDQAITDFQDRMELPDNLSPQERNAILQQASQKLLASPMMHRRPVTARDAKLFLQKAIEHHYGVKAEGFRRGMPSLRGLEGVRLMSDMQTELEKLNGPEHDLAKDAIEILADGHEVLGDCPLARQDIATVGETVEGMKRAIDEKLEGIARLKEQGDVSDTLLALEDELRSMKGKLNEHVEYLADFLPMDPVAKQNLEKTIWMHSRAALLAIDELIRKNPDKAEGLRGLRAGIVLHSDNRFAQRRTGEQDIPDTKAYLDAGFDQINEMLQEGLAELHISGKAEKLIHKQASNAQDKFADFDQITSTYKHRVGEHSYDVTSVITPAKNLKGLTAGYTRDGLRGVSSGSSSESRHCVNLAHTEARAHDGTVLFSAMRHGVLSAFGIAKGFWATVIHRGDDAVRTRANHTRAKEVVKAAINHDDALVRRAIIAARDGTEPPTMDIGSIGLITPDNTRRFFNWISGGLLCKKANEFEQMNDQFAAWKGVEGMHSLQVEDPDRPGHMVRIRVKVDTVAFNFGVNQGAVKGAGPLDSSWSGLGGWQNAKAHNKAGMEKLFGKDLSSESAPLGGKIEEYLKRPDVSDKDKEVVRELATQIRFMWNHETFMDQGGEPYKMVARLAVMCDKMGLKVAFNCKSGKDRTGMLDAHAKNLAAYIHYQGKVPELGRDLSTEDRMNERDAILRGGGLKMQENCVGIGGYKLGSVDDNFIRVGGALGTKSNVIDAPTMRVMEGGAAFVNE